MTDEEGKKSCEHCGKSIPEDAILCLFCGEGVKVDSGVLGKLRYSFWGYFAVLMVLLILAGFILAYVL